MDFSNLTSGAWRKTWPPMALRRHISGSIVGLEHNVSPHQRSRPLGFQSCREAIVIIGKSRHRLIGFCSVYSKGIGIFSGINSGLIMVNDG